MKSWRQRTAVNNSGHQLWPQLHDQIEPRSGAWGGGQPLGIPLPHTGAALGLQTPQGSFVIYQWKRPPLATAPNKIPPSPIPCGSWELSFFRFYKTFFPRGRALQASVRFMKPGNWEDFEGSSSCGGEGG